MASPSFEADDQTDEDFFDKLVNDDDDHVPTVSLTTHVGGDGAGGIIDDCDDDDDDDDDDEAKVFSSLSITEGVSAREADSAGDNAGLRVEGEKDRLDDDGDATIFESLGSHEDAVVDKETAKMLVHGNVNESSEAGAGDEGGLASRSSLGSGKGVKVVQWSSFSSDLNSRGDTGLGSDFFGEWGENSEDPFANVGNVENAGINLGAVPALPRNADANLGFTSFVQSQHSQRYGSEAKENVVEQRDLNGSQYVENQYPGWRYDPKTGQWCPVEEYDANALVVGNASVTEQRSEVSHLQQASQPAAEILDRGLATNSVEYPAHMVFDPNYPGWYYDAIAQEWKSLDTYTPSLNQSASVDYDQHYQLRNIENFASEGIVSQDQITSWSDFAGNYSQQTANAWETQPAVETESSVLSKTEQTGNQYSSAPYANTTVDKQAGFKSTGMPVSYDVANGGFDGKLDASRFQSFSSANQFFQHHNQTILEPARQINFSPSYPSQLSLSYLPGESGNQFSRATGGRSSVGRPPHALVTFGFGGKLIVMKNESSYQTRSAGGIVSVLNLMEVVMEKTDASSFRLGGFDYFQTLSQQSFPGPLVGRNVGTKEVNKWIDVSLANSELPFSNARSGEVVRLLFSLLKIACQHYGKLRSPFVGEQGLNESDCPESAVAKLFASAKSDGVCPSQYGAVTHCLQNLPSEAQIQATAIQVQNLLVSGRKREALQCAQEGQLWGPALIVASQLGEQFYDYTVKQMALKQLVPGSPLQTLCLLIAGNPADLFSNVAVNISNPPGSLNTHQQLAQMGDNGMLDKWGENLAVITANRTKGDELVIIHLGDCLWKDRGEVTSAHLCYLVAEANFEPYSEMARLCLIGADHLRYPRTYASPEAIQRTELYEYSKVLGNSQFLLLPFQPYKLVYAHMLAEVGKVADSLKYCQAILKSLKAGRALEVDTLRQLVLSLEERLKIHQKGGYGNNLASTKLASTLINYTARVVGNLPPSVPLPSSSNAQHNEYTYQSGEAKVSSNPSATIPLSASMGPISEWGGETNRSTLPNRSVSEPDIGRSPKKVDSSKEPTSSDSHEKKSVPGGPSRIGRFGSQLFQKTVGLVLRSRPSQQAKLGDSNKFYYDEKLKRWVEEGAEPPAEEAALPPPPTTGAFLNPMPDHNTKDASETGIFRINSGPEDKSPISSDRASGIPPMPPSSNQFSARGRMGVRSRYVDTFNKGGANPANIFQSPLPAAKTGAAATPKFFIPPAVASAHETSHERGENTEEPVATDENLSESSVSSATSLTPKPAPAPSTPMYIQRFPSVDNIMNKKGATAGEGNSSLAPDSRRVASWSGSTNDSFHSSSKNDVKPLGEELGMSPSAFAFNAGGDPHEVLL